MMEFGFSYVGLVYLIMLFVPNIIWSRYKPVDYDEAEEENPVLLALERIGEVAVCCLVLIAIRVMSSSYLRLLIFLPAILIPACASPSPAFHMIVLINHLLYSVTNLCP